MVGPGFTVARLNGVLGTLGYSPARRDPARSLASQARDYRACARRSVLGLPQHAWAARSVRLASPARRDPARSYTGKRGIG